MAHGTENDPTGSVGAARAERLATVLQAAADPLRLQALTALREGGRSVHALAAELDADDTKLGGELDRLGDLGLVALHDGVYALHDDHVSSLLDEAIGHDQHRRGG